MNDFSDLLFTMAGMLLFSMLVLHTNAAILANERIPLRNEFEKTAFTMAQALVNEARSMAFDEAVAQGQQPGPLPSSFRQNPGPQAGMERRDFFAFDHFHGHIDTVYTASGTFRREAQVWYTEGVYPWNPVQGPTFHKYFQVEVLALQSDARVQTGYLRTWYQ